MWNQQQTTDARPETKAKNKKQIAEDLGVSISTLRRLMKASGLNIRRGLYLAEEWQEIQARLGKRSPGEK